MPDASFQLSAAPPPELCDWRSATQWCVLSTDFGNGQDFLHIWATWHNSAQRPQQLHYVALLAQPIAAADVLTNAPPQLHDLAQNLAPHLWGLLPGVHRIGLENGHVQLTLWVGDAHALLRHQQVQAQRIWIPSPYPHDIYSIKALTRHSQRGARLCTAAPSHELQHALAGQGWQLQDTHTAHYAPHWQSKQRGMLNTKDQPGHALVLGAGLAGAAIAYSLALRGWQVTVLSAGAAPADGASGLPAGLFCPHVSPDDSVLSRLSRSGVRMTLQRLRTLCREGLDWGHTGVLEHCTDGGTGLPADDSPARYAWSHPASTEHTDAAQLPADTSACWHAQAGWVRPAALVQAQLQHANIQWRGNSTAAKLTRTEERACAQWQAHDDDGHLLAHADVAIIACGPASTDLLPLNPNMWPSLQAIRGQITWGLHTPDNDGFLPPFAVNGNGNLVPHVPHGADKLWVMGSTFERDVSALPIPDAEQIQAHRANWNKLSTLLPHSAAPMTPWFTPHHPNCQATWGQVRCASHDRLPIAGPVGPHAPDLWVLTALGARGLTLSILCAELIAAQLHAEPWPLEQKLGIHLGTQRLQRH